MKKIVGGVACIFIAAMVGAVEIQTLELPEGDVGVPYHAVLSAVNGTLPYTWIWSENGYSPSTNIAGLSLSTNGIISGTPTVAFSNFVGIAVIDGLSAMDSQWLELVVYDDRDGDGMLDVWEYQIIDANPTDGIETIEDVLRDDNYDGDAFTNIEEYLLGFDPVTPDGEPLDTVEEGLNLAAKALTNEVDSVYFDLIDGCFATVVANEPTNYSARVYRAASRLLNLSTDAGLLDLVEQFGGSLSFDFMMSGDFDFDTAPMVDEALDAAFTNILPVIDASFADLAAIPSNWTGTAEISTNYFPVDETVYADIGDVTAAMSVLKLVRSFALTLQAQTLNLNYEKMLLPVDAPLASIVVDGSTNDWVGVPVQLVGEYDSVIEHVKAARDPSAIYLLIQAKDTGAVPLGMDGDVLIGEDSSVEIEIHPSWGYTSVWFSATGTNTTEISVVYSNHAVEIEIPVPNGIAISNACINWMGIEYAPNTNEWWITSWEDFDVPFSTPVDIFLQSHPDFMQGVRSEADLSDAKTNLQEAIDLSQLADGLIQARVDVLMHVIEYDPTNETARAEFFARLQEGEESLAGAKQLIITNDMGAAVFDETIHWGAFYQPDYLSRAMLPEFWRIVGQPLAGTLPDPTFGGILPNMSQAKLTAYLQQGGEESLDWDGDGIPNGWEFLHGGHPTSLSAQADSDGDGCSTIAEYLAGTNPTNPASCFKAEFEVDPFQMVISWQASEDRVYDVLWSPSLDQGFQLLETDIAYPQNAYTDAVQRTSAAGFYRVVARIPGPDDLDGDGLPDGWEGAYFGSYSAMAGDDNDGDGQDNIEEYIAGTNPSDGNSVFELTSARSGISGFVVEWVSVPDRAYSVKWASELGAVFEPLSTDIDYPVNSYSDTTHNAESKGYYKVDVRLK